MFKRTVSVAVAVLAALPALSGCASGPAADAQRSGIVANGPDDGETRAERYARGDYRRGFKDDEARNIEFCRLHPADNDCIGHRF